MRILFACGGTAGHINPALAVAQTIKKQYSDSKILFVGNPGGMESRLVPKAGFTFAPIEIQGFRRRINASNLAHNMHSLVCLTTATKKANSIINDFEPDFVMGTGGYVSGPVLRAASKLGIPTVTHEQNAFPGVTTKLLTKYADKILLAVPEAREHLPEGENYVVTGNPIRQDILFADRGAARERFAVGDRMCVLSFGGSLGAENINKAMAGVIAHFYLGRKLHHIHATGQYGAEMFPRLLSERGVSAKDNHVDVRTYIDDMPNCLAAADLVICRSGAISLSELQAAGRASILIPSPNVAENHQYHNAMVLAARNAAIVIEEKDLDIERLCATIDTLLQDRQELINIGKNAASMAIVDAADRIVKELLSTKKIQQV